MTTLTTRIGMSDKDINPVTVGMYMERLDHVASELLRYANALEAYNIANTKEHSDTKGRLKVLEDERNNAKLLISGGYNTIKGLGFIGVVMFLFAAKGVYVAIDWVIAKFL